MKKFIPILILFIACSESNEVPEDIIAKEKFIEILYEIEIIDAIQIQNIKSIDQSDSLTLGNYKFLFENFNITKDEFDRSFSFYQNEKEMMMEITDSLISRISRHEEEVSTELRNLRWRSKKEND